MNSYLLKNKKGLFKNHLAIIIFIFAFAITNIMAYSIYLEFTSAASTAGLLVSEDAQKAERGFARGLNMYDPLLVIIMAIMIVAIGVSSYKIAAPPIFFLITFVTAILLGLVSYFFNYMFITFVSQDFFAAVLVHFPLTIIICSNLHWVALGSIVIGSITLYAKRDQGQYV